MKAARLRTLPLSLSGIIVGSAMAVPLGLFRWNVFLLALLVTVGLQIISNLANDYGDGVKGTDNADRIGPERAIQSGEISPEEMKKAIIGTAVITFLLALLLIYAAFGTENWQFFLLFIVLGLLSIYAAIRYTVGENPYGYAGYGDLFVLLFFGLLSVCGSYFLYAKMLSFSVFLPALAVGLLSTGVLNLNNMRDVKSDEKAGKRTLVVKIGLEFAKYYHLYILFSALLLSLVYVLWTNRSPYQYLFLLAYVPIGKHMYFVWLNQKEADFDPELKKLALGTFFFALLFALGEIL